MIAPLIRAVAPYAALATAGALLWHWTPWIGPVAVQGRLERRLETARDAAAAWERHARGWQATAEASETVRGRETDQARAAIEAAGRQCQARIAEARRSSAAIDRIVTIPAPEAAHAPADPSVCPDRRLVDPDELRRSIQPAG